MNLELVKLAQNIEQKAGPNKNSKTDKKQAAAEI